MKTKKLVSILIAVILLISAFCIPTSAAVIAEETGSSLYKTLGFLNADGTLYRCNYFIAHTDEDAVEYNPVTNPFTGTVHDSAAWGPYSDINFWDTWVRVDLEIALTGVNSGNFAGDSAFVFRASMDSTTQVYNIRKKDVLNAPDSTTNAGYKTLSMYFNYKGLYHPSAHEFRIYLTDAAGKASKVGFKLKSRSFYSVAGTFTEVDDNLTDFWNASDSMRVNNSMAVADTSAGTLTYDADNKYEGYAIYGPYTQLPKGKYLVEVETKLPTDSPYALPDNAVVYNFDINSAAGSLKASEMVRVKDLTVDGSDGFKVYQQYFEVTADEGATNVEMRFYTGATQVDFSIREIRVYSIDSLPEETAANDSIVWSNFSGNALNGKSGYITTNSDNALEYNPVTAKTWDTVISGPYLSVDEGIYRLEVEVALTGNNVEGFNNTWNRAFYFGATANSGATTVLEKQRYLIADLNSAESTEVNGNTYYKYQTITRLFRVDETTENIEFVFDTSIDGAEGVGFAVRYVTLSKVEAQKGDLDCDGAVSATDLTILRKYLLNDNETILGDADVKGPDGVINILDLVRLKKIVVGIAEADVAVEPTTYFTEISTADTVFYTNTDCLRLG